MLCSYNITSPTSSYIFCSCHLYTCTCKHHGWVDRVDGRVDGRMHGGVLHL